MTRLRAAFERLTSEKGTTLIETAVASGILLVVMAGLMGMASLATTLTENQGHLGARTTEYAVDKMEQLQELTYGDAQSNTTVFPSVNNGGTGLAVGGSSNPAAPVVGYADYLDSNGNILCTVANPCVAVASRNLVLQAGLAGVDASGEPQADDGDRDRPDERRRGAALAVDRLRVQDQLSDWMLTP